MIYNSKGTRGEAKKTNKYHFTGFNSLQLELERDRFNLFEACLYTELDQQRQINEGYIIESETASEKSKRQWKNIVETIKTFFRKLSVKIQEIFNNFYIAYIKVITKNGKEFQKTTKKEKLAENLKKCINATGGPKSTKYTTAREVKYQDINVANIEKLIDGFKAAQKASLETEVKKYIPSRDSSDTDHYIENEGFRNKIKEVNYEKIRIDYTKTVLREMMSLADIDITDKAFAGKASAAQTSTADIDDIMKNIFGASVTLDFENLLKQFAGTKLTTTNVPKTATVSSIETVISGIGQKPNSSYANVVKYGFEYAQKIKSANKIAQYSIKKEIQDCDNIIELYKVDHNKKYADSGLKDLEKEALRVAAKVLNICASVKQQEFVRLCRVICKSISKAYKQDLEVVKAVYVCTESCNNDFSTVNYNYGLFTEEVANGVSAYDRAVFGEMGDGSGDWGGDNDIGDDDELVSDFPSGIDMSSDDYD